MHFLVIKLLILNVIFDNVALGLIPLHNGRIVNSRRRIFSGGGGKNASAPHQRQLQRSPAGFMVRPKRRDASVFRLKFLDGTDTDAFEFVNPGSGWRQHPDEDDDRSATSGPFEYVEPIGDYEYPLETPRPTSTTRGDLTDDETDLIPATTDERWTVPTPPSTSTYGDDDDNYILPQSTKSDIQAGWPIFEEDADEEEKELVSKTTFSPFQIDEDDEEVTKWPTFSPDLCNDTSFLDEATTTKTTTLSSTLALTTTTTANPCVTPPVVAKGDATTKTSSTEPTLKVETTEMTTSSIVTETVTEPTVTIANNETTTTMEELSTKSPTAGPENVTVDATTMIYDETNSAEIIEALNSSNSSNVTSLGPLETTTVVVESTTGTGEIADGSGSTLMPNETTTTSSSQVTVPEMTTTQDTTKATSIDYETSLETSSIESTTSVHDTTTSNFTIVVPFANLNVAKVRMSVHVTKAFTRKQLEKLLQQGLQNAFLSALNRNNRVDDTLFELKRIIRMAGAVIEIFDISIPHPDDHKSAVTHLNVTFGAVLPHPGERSNHTMKSHTLARRTLPGRHVREIMQSVTPIELSAAAGIPIESIRPANEHDYDIIVNNWYSQNATEGESEEEQPRPEEQAVPNHKLPDWVLPVAIVGAALVLVLVYVVVTGVCVLKGYRLRLEKVGSLAITSPDGGEGSYAEGAARLAEVVSSPPNRQSGSPSNFAVKPLAPVSQMFIPAESASPTATSAAAKPQLELRRWTIDGQDERILNKMQHQEALSVDVSSDKKPVIDVTCDKSMNTSNVALHNIATTTEGPELVTRATSAVHQQNRTVATSSTQFQTDQSTDTTVDIGQKMKNVQTTTINSCFNSTVVENGTTPDSAVSVGVTIDGEQQARNSSSVTVKLPTPGLRDRHKRRSRRRRERPNEHPDAGDGNENNKAVREGGSKEGMANNAGSANGILLHPLELRYDTIYLNQNEKGDAKQVDTPFKVVKLVPGVDVKEQLVHTVQPVLLEDAKKIDGEMKESRKRSSSRHGKEKMVVDKKEGEQFKTLLDTVEGIVRKYAVRQDGEDNKMKADVNEALQQTIQRDINYIKPRPKVGRNMRAVSPEGSPKAPPMLASFEAALRLRVADETISEERVRRQYQIPLVQNSAGNTSILAKHLLERGKIGCLPEM